MAGVVSQSQRSIETGKLFFFALSSSSGVDMTLHPRRDC